MTVVEAAYLPPDGTELIVTAAPTARRTASTRSIPRPARSSRRSSPPTRPPASTTSGSRPTGQGSLRRGTAVTTPEQLSGPRRRPGRQDDSAAAAGGAVSRTLPPGRTTGRTWRSPAATPSTTRTWPWPWSPPTGGSRASSPPMGSPAAATRPPVGTRRHVDPGLARGSEQPGPGGGQHLLVDPLTGGASPAPWTGNDPPTWQRLAR